MMVRFYIILVTLLLAHSLYAQQKVLNHISNDYLVNANELKSVSSINSLRNNIYKKRFGENHPYQTEEIDGRSAYYKVLYKKTSSATEEGLVDIWYAKSDGNKINIEDNVNNFYKIYLMDYDEKDYVKQFVKTSTVHGGFFFNKKNNDIYIHAVSAQAGFCLGIDKNQSDT